MSQDAKGANATILIGRDANDSEIKINTNELKTAIDGILKDKFEKRINKLECNKIKTKFLDEHKYAISLGIITLFAAIFFLLAVWLNRKFYFGISDSGRVIAFVGILATFVVISNYMQVKEVRDEFHNIKDAVDILENRANQLNSKLDDAEKKMNSIKCSLNLELISSYSNNDRYLNANSIIDNIVYASESVAKGIGVDSETFEKYLNIVTNFYFSLGNMELVQYIEVATLELFIEYFPKKILKQHIGIIDDLYRLIVEIHAKKAKERGW
jgi:hypothetical protein